MTYVPPSTPPARRLRMANTPSVKELRKIAEHCCSKCEYDEAEGGLFRHCSKCMEWIVKKLWSITHDS